eukprot:11811669-Ditylum_brightwellii.AAC.1
MNKQAEVTVLEKFPYKDLSKCSDATSYVELAKVRNEVYKNLTAIDSALNGNNGHLGLAMSDPGYTNQAGGAFVEIPSNPGPYNLTIATNTGSVTRARREAEHQEKREAYHIQEACKTITKNQLDLAIPR